MKKLFLLTALCALTIAGNAYNYNYLAAPTNMNVSQNGSTFTLSWTQVCKNTAMYESAPNGGVYTTTVKLVLHADDSKLEGVYTESGSKTIDMSNTELVYVNGATTTKRKLISGSESTFTITKEDDQYYSISVGCLYFQNAGSTADTYKYDYCYDESKILKKGITRTPFLFSLTKDEVGDYYLCAITDMKVDTLKSTSKNQFTLNFTQKCKYAMEYQFPNKTYTRTVKLVLNSDDRTLDGVYTTEGASPTSSSANVNDQTINLVTSEISYDGNNYVLRSDVVSTFTIIKIDENTYGVSAGELYFTQRVNKTSTLLYKYCYGEDEVCLKDATPKPFAFGYTGEYVEKRYDYDMTVNGISVTHENTAYGAIRYFLTLSCRGKNRDNNAEHNYEVQLAIYPQASSIVGEFSTRGEGIFMIANYCYVKDLNIGANGKQRNLNNDSTSTIKIQDKGSNQYSFYGGTLICTDLDANMMSVYGKKRIEAAHYYHFSDNNGEGISFGYDESNTTVNLTITKVVAEEIVGGYRLTVTGKEGAITFIATIDLEGTDELTGSFTTSDALSLWTKVARGSNTGSKITSGATVTINKKSGTTYTLSGNLLCENGYTFQIPAFDFTYGTTTGVESIQNSEFRIQKIIRDGQMIIIRDGKEYNAFGVEL